MMKNTLFAAALMGAAATTAFAAPEAYTLDASHSQIHHNAFHNMRTQGHSTIQYALLWTQSNSKQTTIKRHTRKWRLTA